MLSSGPHPIRAAIWMVGTVISFSVMAVAGREATIDLDIFEILLYRSLAGLAIVLVIAACTRTLSEIRISHFGLHLVRNACHLSGMLLWFYAISAITFAQVFALEFSTPLWTAILAPLFIAERLTPTRKWTAIAGFIGILIVARPGLAEISPGLLAAACCAIGFAGAAVATKSLVRVASVTCILFWMVAIQAVLCLVLAGIDGQVDLPPSSSIFPLAFVSLAGLTAHYCLTKALSLAPAVVVMPLDFFRLPIIAVVGLLLYAEPLDALVMMGAGIIIASNIVNIRSEARISRQDRQREMNIVENSTGR